MHVRVLSWGFHWGEQIQEKLAERAYADVGEEHWHDQKNRGVIYPGELHRGGTRDLIRVDISTTSHLVNEGCICRSG